MSTYKAQIHGTTDGKLLSRDIVNSTVIEMVQLSTEEYPQALPYADGVSLPAEVGKQEADLIAALSEIGRGCEITCAEFHFGTYWKNVKNQTFKKLPITYINGDFTTAFSEASKTGAPNWFWFDACGNAFNAMEYNGSNLEKFIQCLQGLHGVGVGFFTAKVTPRSGESVNSYDLYEGITGIRKDKLQHSELTEAYAKIVRKALPSNYNLFCKVIYQSVKSVFFVFGVAKGWNPATVNVDMIADWPHIGASTAERNRHKCKNKQTPTKKEPLMNPIIKSIIALTAIGKTAQEVALHLGIDHHKVAGYKAAIQRSAYGPIVKADYNKAVAKAMLISGGRDKAILSKTGLTTMQLAGIKAHRTRKANANA